MMLDTTRLGARGNDIDLVFWPGALAGQPLAAQLDAAAAGSFTSLALDPLTYKRVIAQGLRPADIHALANERRVVINQLDGMTGWTSIRHPPNIPPEFIERFDMSREESLDIAAAMGMQSVVAVGGFEFGAIPAEDLLRDFADLCDCAAARGLRVDLEFIPFWGIADLSAAWHLVCSAGRANATVLVDTWHLQKGSRDFETDMALLETIDGRYLTNVQLADAALAPLAGTLIEDCGRFRRFPGDGELDIQRIVSLIARKGGLTKVGPEIFSDEIAALDPGSIGRRAGDATRHVLAALE